MKNYTRVTIMFTNTSIREKRKSIPIFKVTPKNKIFRLISYYKKYEILYIV